MQCSWNLSGKQHRKDHRRRSGNRESPGAAHSVDQDREKEAKDRKAV
jgi:hypothetical protein